ncbi:unnamed protein product [Ilex paraguariensis]|uniref:Hydroxyproline-rich glycoprotein family protein n=1 Tax=Ilex paraguariensis TaxID=185542 RepID=A0ABC8SV26_9AQUA
MAMRPEIISQMAEKEPSENCNRKQVKQLISVPFLWEEKPGTPKKDWRPGALSINPVAPPPLKLIASVPFDWEEKPGKPLPCFSQPPPESAIVLPLAKISNCTPTKGSEHSSAYSHNDEDDNDDDGQDGSIFELELEARGFETDESFSSAPSLLANRLVSTVAISSAVPDPVQQTFPLESNSGQLQTPPSPASETDSSTRSYATGTTSLVGTSFLECLFPLLSPHSSFLDKVGCPAMDLFHVPQKVLSKNIDRENDCSAVIRRPPTLGELIMMSRRRSYIRKAVQMRRKSPSMQQDWTNAQEVEEAVTAETDVEKMPFLAYGADS